RAHRYRYASGHRPWSTDRDRSEVPARDRIVAELQTWACAQNAKGSTRGWLEQAGMGPTSPSFMALNMVFSSLRMDNAPAMARKKSNGYKTGWRRRVVLALLVGAGTAYVWLLRLTCRIRVVEGQQYLDAALAAGVVIPCSWHQQLLTGGLFLRDLIPQGLKTGFLISPSREGEFITRVVENHGPQVMRGSSSRTGRQAVRVTLSAIRCG